MDFDLDLGLGASPARAGGVTPPVAATPKRYTVGSNVANSNSSVFSTHLSIPLEANKQYCIRLSLLATSANNDRNGKFKLNALPMDIVNADSFWNWTGPPTLEPPNFVTGESVCTGIMPGAGVAHTVHAYLNIKTGPTAFTLEVQHAIGSDGSFTIGAGSVADVFECLAVRAAADVDNSSSTVFSDLFADVPLAAGRKYVVVMCLPVQTAAGGTGLVWRWQNLGDATALSGMVVHSGGGGAGCARATRADGTAINAVGSAGLVTNSWGFALISTTSAITPDFQIRSEVNTSQVSVKAGATLFFIDVTDQLVVQMADTTGGDVTDDDASAETAITFPLTDGDRLVMWGMFASTASGTTVGVDVLISGLTAAASGEVGGMIAHLNNQFDQNYAESSRITADVTVTRANSAGTAERPTLLDVTIREVTASGNMLVQVRKENVAGDATMKGLSWVAAHRVELAT